MPEQPKDQWFSRDQVVLDAAAIAVADGDRVSVDELTETTGIDREKTQRAMDHLYESSYVSGVNTSSGLVLITDLTERGRRATGVWPSESEAKAFLQTLEAAEAAETDPDKKTKIRSVLEGVRDMGTTVTGQVLSAYLKAHLGL